MAKKDLGFGKKILSRMNLNFDDEYDDYDDDDYDDYDDDEKENKPSLFKRDKRTSDDSYDSDEDTPKSYAKASYKDEKEFTPRNIRTTTQSSARAKSKLVPIKTAKEDNTVFAIKVKGLVECASIIDFLKEGQVIILNLNDVDENESQRIIDNISGCCYAIKGSLKCVALNIYVVAPYGIQISGDFLPNNIKDINGQPIAGINNFYDEL